MNNEQNTNKRAWVKNAAIIFLAVMLVLTFFSNTILNYSLPEVSGQYASYSSISTSVRGSGTVEANMAYNVTIDSSRQIKSVLIKVGDTVEAGQALFLLENADSTELKAAREVLDAAQQAYETALINAAPEEYAANRNIIELRERLAAAQKTLNSIKAGTSAAAQARQEAERLKTDLEKQTASLAGEISYVEAISAGSDPETLTCSAEIKSALSALISAQENYNALLSAGAGSAALSDAELRLKNAESGFEAAKTNEISVLNGKLAAANEQLAAAEEAYEAALLAEQEAILNSGGSLEDAEANVKNCQRDLEYALLQLSSQQKLDEMSLKNLQKAVDEAQAEVNRLSGNDGGSEIVTKYAGVVTSVNCMAGDTAMAGDPVATIDVEGKGYTLSIPVTIEQSRQVKVGDAASITNWWGNIDAVLTAIKVDRTNPNKSKILEFTVTGDVSDGQVLEISVGEKQTGYDSVVPNSAIREDSSGTYVLVAKAKDTPLSTRYTATRVDVTVIAKDNINSAISTSETYFYEYVITTSSKPVEPGDQVRLVES